MALKMRAAVLAVSGVVAMMSLGAAWADTLQWTFRSEHPNTVSLEFYSQDYNRAWPGGGEVYIIDDWDSHYYNWNAAPASRSVTAPG